MNKITKILGALAIFLGTWSAFVHSRPDESIEPNVVQARQLRIGRGSTPDVTPGDDDAFIEGTLEVDGAVRFDGGLNLSGGTNSIFTPDSATAIEGTISSSAVGEVIYNATDNEVCISTTAAVNDAWVTLSDGSSACSS